MSRNFGFILFISLSSTTFRKKGEHYFVFTSKECLDIPMAPIFCHKFPTFFLLFPYFYISEAHTFLPFFNMKSLEILWDIRGCEISRVDCTIRQFISVRMSVHRSVRETSTQRAFGNQTTLNQSWFHVMTLDLCWFNHRSLEFRP